MIWFVLGALAILWVIGLIARALGYTPPESDEDSSSYDYLWYDDD